ncbi:MAG: outer membrane beta-barrel protein [Pseudomonadales bacterium]
MKTIGLWLTPLVFLFGFQQAFAAWDETVSVLVDNPDDLRGAKVTFAPTGAAPVEGEVQEDEDGNVFLYFPLPGNGPTPGTIAVDTGDGEPDEFPVPARSSNSTLILDFDAGTVSVSSLLGAPRKRGFELHLGLGISQWYTDSLAGVASGSADELGGLFANQGLTGISISDSADDDVLAYGVTLTAVWPITDSGAVYLRGGAYESKDFEASVRGSGSLGPAAVLARNDIEAELESLTFSIGYEHDLGNGLDLYGGAGYANTSTDIDFVSNITVGGIDQGTLRGSETDDEDSWLLEAGIRYSFGGKSKPFSIRAGVQHIDEIAGGEDLTRLELGISYKALAFIP